jgi:hypothetical protein
MSRRRLQLDTRPRWNDPDLKSQIFPHYPPLSADWIHKNAELAMKRNTAPIWRKDPTYDLRRKKNG